MRRSTSLTSAIPRRPSPARTPIVGRDVELAALDDVIACDDGVAFVVGPPGIGKTAVLRELEQRCRGRGIATAWIDARLDVTDQRDLEALAARLPPRAVVLVDDLHRICGLERWIALRWIPGLPAGVRVVIASALRPGSVWLEPGAPPSRAIDLPALSRQACEAYVAARGLRPDRAREVIELAWGNPLILSVACDLAEHEPAGPAALRHAVLARTFPVWWEHCDTDDRRAAMTTIALARTATYELVEAIIGDAARAAETYAWLAQQAIVEHGGDGLRAHPALRSACLDLLRVHHPALVARTFQRALRFYVDRIQRDPAPSRWILDRLYLERDVAVWRPHLDWELEIPPCRVDVLAGDDDVAAVLSIVERHEGPEARGHVARWLADRPDDVDVLRAGDGTVAGFLVALRLDGPPTADERRDPALDVIARYLERIRWAPAPGGRILVHRAWGGVKRYQEPGPESPLLHTHMIRHLLTTPGLELHFRLTADPARWTALYTYSRVDHEIAGEVVVDGVTYTVIAGDRRLISIEEALARASQAALTAHDTGPGGAPRGAARAAGDDGDGLARALWRRVAEIAERVGLSEREREVLDLLLLGRTTAEIGAALGITERTARFHQTNVLDKLGADTRLDILRLLL